MAAAVGAFGGIDILINNAAIMVDVPLFGLSNMLTNE
jgi:NAD(P)-dependent dehydrogenase (short-subunit alcohol dehydrogenase family)